MTEVNDTIGSPPHAWGIRAQGVLLEDCVFGSPPHAWGILAYIVASAQQIRFTPTRVGNTLSPAT